MFGAKGDALTPFDYSDNLKAGNGINLGSIYMLWTLSSFPMTIGKQSPIDAASLIDHRIASVTENRLVFESKHQYLLLYRIIYWLSIPYCLFAAGSSMSTAGNLLALILSKTVKASYLHIVNDIPLLLGFSFIIVLSVVCASILLWIPFGIVKLNVTEFCAFERGTSSDLHFEEVCIHQRNIFTNKKKIIKLQLDTILDIRLESPGWRNGWKFTIGLITSQQLESICVYHSSLPGVWKIDPSKVGVNFQATINSLNPELKLTRNFLYLSPKPAYLNKVISNSIFPELHKLYHRLKILDETSSNLTYKLTHSLSPYGETWNFNSGSGIVTVQYRYFVKISTKSIAMDTIQTIFKLSLNG